MDSGPCALFRQDIHYYRAIIQESEKTEEALIVALKKLPAEGGLPDGAKCLKIADGSVDVSGALSDIKEITPQEAIQLIEQSRQDGYREVDRHLTAIKKIAKLF